MVYLVSPLPVVAPEISDFRQGGGEEQLGLCIIWDQRQVRATHAPPRGTALRSARARPSSEGEGGTLPSRWVSWPADEVL